MKQKYSSKLVNADKVEGWVKIIAENRLSGKLCSYYRNGQLIDFEAEHLRPQKGKNKE